MSLVKILFGIIFSALSLINFGYMAIQNDSIYKFWLISASILLTTAGLTLYADGIYEKEVIK